VYEDLLTKLGRRRRPDFDGERMDRSLDGGRVANMASYAICSEFDFGDS
jgi:hypothetical protein